MRVILETTRLRLREMEAGDLDFMAEMLGDPDVMHHYPHTLDRDGAQAWLDHQIRRYERDGHAFWLVEGKDDGKPKGQVGLLRQTLEDGDHPEVGYMIHRPFQQQGIATEAAMAVRDHAFRELDRPYVVSFIRPENIPSQKVAWKLGMEPERMIQRGGWDHLVFLVERGKQSGVPSSGPPD
jgi:RimJ/RimL family protein N-acetyltransferase